MKTILFVCEHGAAKSIVAAAYFNKLAMERNSDVRAIARGTLPDAELSAGAVEGLKHDGLMPTQSVPQKLALADIESAERLVTFCELPDEYRGTAVIEQWNDIPPVSEGYEKARDAIIEKLNRLIIKI